MRSNLFSIKGYFELRQYDKESGELLNEFCEDNVFLENGMEQTLQAFTIAGSANTLSTLRIGDDVGGGTLSNPSPATSDLDQNNQDELYSQAFDTVNYPQFFSVEFITTLDGQQVLDTFPPDQVDLRFTSAALYTENGNACAYRRFPARTLTEQTTIEIKWTLAFEGQG